MRGTFGVRVRLGLVQELQKAVLPVGAQCAVKGAEEREGKPFYVCGFAKLEALEVHFPRQYYSSRRLRRIWHPGRA